MWLKGSVQTDFAHPTSSLFFFVTISVTGEFAWTSASEITLTDGLGGSTTVGCQITDFAPCSGDTPLRAMGTNSGALGLRLDSKADTSSRVD